MPKCIKHGYFEYACVLCEDTDETWATCNHTDTDDKCRVCMSKINRYPEMYKTVTCPHGGPPKRVKRRWKYGTKRNADRLNPGGSYRCSHGRQRSRCTVCTNRVGQVIRKHPKCPHGRRAYRCDSCQVGVHLEHKEIVDLVMVYQDRKGYVSLEQQRTAAAKVPVAPHAHREV